MNSISEFIEQVKKRVRTKTFVAYCGPAASIAAVAAFIQALCYVIPGYKVDAVYLAIPLGLTFLAYLLFCLSKLPKNNEAAHFADQFFDLKDALVSQLDFEKRQLNGANQQQFCQLQLAQTVKVCSSKNASDIPIFIPRRSLALALVLFVTTGVLCSFDEAAEITEKRQLEEAVLLASKENKVELEKELEELEETLSKAEKELLKSSKLKEMMKDLKSGKDKKDALRQYAKLEQKIKQMSEQLKLRQDEKLLAELARRLEKNRSTSKLAKMLATKQYKAAAKNLQKFKQNSKMSLAERQKLNDQLKNITKRMKAASQQMKNNKSDMKEKMAQLSKATEEMDKSLQQAAQECKNGGEMSKECKECLNKSEKNSNSSLAQMCKSLDKAGTKKNFMKKMNALQKALAKAQAKMNKPGQLAGKGQGKGQGKGMGQGQGKGKGKGIGMGSDNSLNNDLTTQLQPGVDSQLIGI